MPTFRMLVFVCDRCGIREEKDLTEFPSWQPIGWGAAAMTKPPLAGFDNHLIILCGPCMERVRDAMRPVGMDGS